MTTVAKGTKKPSHSSNMSLPTIEFLMKGQVLGGKGIVGYPLPWKPICCHGNQKSEFYGSMQNFKAYGYSVGLEKDNQISFTVETIRASE